MVYTERASIIPEAVCWHSTTGGATRVLPDGCLDLLWYGDQLVVAGPDTTAYLSTPVPAGVTGLRFAPGVGPTVLGVPAHELRDRRVRLDALWPAAEVRRLGEQVAAAPDRGRALESIAGRRLAHAVPDPLMRAVAVRLSTGESVASVAEAASLGERQLHRRCLVAFGYGPKTLGRILRLGRALTLARGGVSVVECSLRAGFADQAHLAREVHALTGSTVTGLLS